MTIMNFILGENVEFEIIDNIEDATHWIAYEDEKSIVKDSVTVGNIYRLELLKDIIGWDYFIKDDKDQYGMHYMIHRGDFIKVF